MGVAIETLNLAKERSGIAPAKAAFNSVGALLAMIRVSPSPHSSATSFGLTRIQESVANEVDYVDLGLACADACRALDQGVNGRQADQISQLVVEAIGQLTT